MAVVNGKAMWAHVHKPDTRFGAKYSIDLHVSKKDYDELQKLGTGGLKVDSDGNYVAKFKTSANWKDGSPKKHPPVVGPDGQTAFDQDIGNGSDVNVAYSIYEYKGFGGGKSLILEGVQVVNHIAYEGGGEEVSFAPVEGGAAPASSDNPFA